MPLAQNLEAVLSVGWGAKAEGTIVGFLRTLLALSVVSLHSPPYHGAFTGTIAVPMFYAVSGYLISYILTESKSYVSIGSFYASRALRLLPLYYFVLIAILILGFWFPFELAGFHDLPPLAKTLVSITSVTVLGQESVYALGVQGGHLVVSGNATTLTPPLWQFLPDQPSWSLSLELQFYLLAPFVLRRVKLMWALLALSLVGRVVIALVWDHANELKDYRFFPLELWTFLAGALAHRHGAPVARAILARIPWMDYAISGVAAMAMIGTIWVDASHINGLQFVALRAVAALLLCPCLPFLSAFQRRAASLSRFDRWIGELSYPVYIAHRLMILVTHVVLTFTFPKINYTMNELWIVLAATTGFAALAAWALGATLEPLRHGLRGKGPRPSIDVGMTTPDTVLVPAAAE
jgi:peptidoglycan/LPS O-acetylase OafA/YrhL